MRDRSYYSPEATEQRNRNAARLIATAYRMVGEDGTVSAAALCEQTGLSKADFIEAMTAHLDANHLVPAQANGYAPMTWRGEEITAVTLNI